MPPEVIGESPKRAWTPRDNLTIWKDLLARLVQRTVNVLSSSEVELPVDKNILHRENQLNLQDPNREIWVLQYVRLCSEWLDVLEKIKRDTDMEYSFAYYAFPKWTSISGPCKKVVVSLPCEGELEEVRVELEKKLKLNLFSRGSNSGVLFRIYKKEKTAFAEAVPAILDGE